MSTSPDPRPVPTPVPIPEARQRRDNLFIAYSGKERRLLRFESETEYRAFVYFEGQSAVARLCEQAYKIDAMLHGKRLLYTFDLWLRWRDLREEYLEIKPADELRPARDGILKPAKWDDIEFWCGLHQVSCRFVTDKDLAEHTIFIDNWIQALPYVQRAHLENNSDLTERVFRFVNQGRPVSLCDIEQFFPGIDVGSLHACAFLLVHEGRVTADMATEPIDRRLLLEVPDG